MSFIAYYKPAHNDIEKLIEKHVDSCRKNVPWDGEHRQVVKDIVKIFKRLTQMVDFLFELFVAILWVSYVASIYYIIYDYIWENFIK